MAAGTANAAPIAARRIRDPRDCESGLANSECHRAGGNANERRAEDIGATKERHHAGADCDKKSKA